MKRAAVFLLYATGAAILGYAAVASLSVLFVAARLAFA